MGVEVGAGVGVGVGSGVDASAVSGVGVSNVSEAGQRYSLQLLNPAKLLSRQQCFPVQSLRMHQPPALHMPW